MSIIDTAKDLYELVKKGATVESQKKVMQLREEAVALQGENVELKTRIKELEEALAVQESLEFDGRVYWQVTKGKKTGPFCQRCYDFNKQLIRLQAQSTYIGDQVEECWECKACQNIYER